MTIEAERRPDDEDGREPGGAGTDAEERDPEIGPGSTPMRTAARNRTDRHPAAVRRRARDPDGSAPQPSGGKKSATSAAWSDGRVGTSFDVVDPRGVESPGQGIVHCDHVQSHPQVARVPDAVVPPGEPAGTRTPAGDVDVDQPRGQELVERCPFGRGDMRGADERVRVEHVAVGRRDVEVAGDHDALAVAPPLPNGVRERSHEGELVLVVPMVHGPTVRDVHRHHTQRRGELHDTRRDAGLAIERRVVEPA